MQLIDLVETAESTADTRSRLKKRAVISERLKQAATKNEVALIVHYLAGSLPQGRFGLGPAMVRKVAGHTAAATPSLSLKNVDGAFQEIAQISGKGSQQTRRRMLQGVIRSGDESRATLPHSADLG